MKIIPRALSAGLALAAVPAQAFVTYQDIVSAATNPDDLSRQALVTIFGDVVTNPLTASSNTIIGNLFMVFNAIIATMGIVWFLFIGIRHAVRTGHQGNVFNNGRDVVGMLSIVSGFMMIVPTASGWSLAQLVMLWGASIMGIGSANIMVQTAAENIAEGYSMTVQPVHVSTRTAARGILEMELCKHAMNTGLDDFNRTARSSTPPMSESSRTENGRYTVTVSNGSATCGSVSLSVKGNGSNKQSALAHFFNPFIETEYQGVLTAQRSAMDTMLRDLDSAAQEFVSAYLTRRDTGNGNLPDIESRIQKAANRYEETVQKALPTDNAETERREQLKSYLTTYGWVALGAWYQTFATANQRLEDLANRAPTVSGVSSLGEAGDTEFLKEVKGAYQAQLQNSTYTPALGTIKTANEYNSASTSDPKSVILDSVRTIKFTNYIATVLSGSGSTTDQLNPLIKMKNIGDYTMVTTETIWAGYTTVRVLSTAGSKSVFGRLVNVVSGLSDAAKAVLDAFAPPLYFLLFLLFCAGFSLSIYLPFIPFIFWMTGIGNWIVSVLIGCAAGPLWAATHLGTSQDRGNRAAYGYIYLIDSMIRPLLMVFGFFFASVAIVAGGTILNALFGAALVNVQANSLTGLFSIAGFLLIYARVCTTLVAAVFALQAYLPDHVINFLGGRDGVNMLGNMVSSVKDIIAGGNTNMRRTPGVREDKLKNIKGDDKDGIKQ
ncbi:TPA: DotA/TraY family protein [Escherichia coli]|uniref:DotA/TraY family protein n=1 Tax=Escherichia coli TaxID=562 RepID=UPI0007A01E84|nr:DotA/TraY family protein [Escherichia coli]EFK3426631.1 DotA/TraY family protein [Escherichia coli]EFK3903242.1 DotA/TraY family protein [Escherichia coli]EFM6922715.1 DotA/TraY family protein [Escherichia coli]EFM7289836.1 DotA/TraY family protein [Escherichia coli]EFM8140674.1 DotA/TraY family protein [Escherichia coli]